MADVFVEAWDQPFPDGWQLLTLRTQWISVFCHAGWASHGAR